jgi:hypothetical protein
VPISPPCGRWIDAPDLERPGSTIEAEQPLAQPTDDWLGSRQTPSIRKGHGVLKSLRGQTVEGQWPHILAIARWLTTGLEARNLLAPDVWNTIFWTELFPVRSQAAIPRNSGISQQTLFDRRSSARTNACRRSHWPATISARLVESARRVNRPSDTSLTGQQQRCLLTSLCCPRFRYKRKGRDFAVSRGDFHHPHSVELFVVVDKFPDHTVSELSGFIVTR